MTGSLAGRIRSEMSERAELGVEALRAGDHTVGELDG